MSQITDPSVLAAASMPSSTLKKSSSFSGGSLNFIDNTDLTSNFEFKASPDINKDLFRGTVVYYFDALIGATFHINLTSSYGSPVAIIFNSLGTALVANTSEIDDVTKSVILDFIAPRTDRYYLFSSTDPSDKNVSLSILEDRDTSPAYTLPEPEKAPVIAPPEIPQKITNQKLVGTSESDSLIGDDGNDSLTGGQGFDTLTGGKGSDKFIFTSIKDAPVSHSKIEVITDFSSSEKDKIDLSKIDADTSKAKDQAFSKPEIGAEFSGVFSKAGQLFFDTTNHILYGNVNADETADFAIQLNGVNSLVATDFIL